MSIFLLFFQFAKNIIPYRFSPRVNGKRIAKNIYATTREECEEKLKALIAEMKKEIAEIKAGAKSKG